MYRKSLLNTSLQNSICIGPLYRFTNDKMFKASRYGKCTYVFLCLLSNVSCSQINFSQERRSDDDGLEVTLERISSQLQVLQSSNDVMQSKYDALKGENDDLKSKYADLQANYSVLKGDHDALQSQHNVLQNTVTSIQGWYASLL